MAKLPPGGEKVCREWCEKAFGMGGRKYKWRQSWTDKVPTFYFRDERHATLFTLKWSS